jgi:signal transduction histidine kinase
VTRRLLISYLGIALVILIILEVPMGVLAQRFERNLATAQAERDANGFATLANEDVERGQVSNLRSLLAGFQARTGAELLVVRRDGSVLAASSTDADNDATTDWKAIAARALAGQGASSFRSDEGAPVAVAAVPVDAANRSLGALVLGTPANLTEHRIHEIWLVLATFAAAALCVTAALGVLLARSMARPLGRLESAVARLGHGDLSARARDDEGLPEIRSLAEQFNQMAGRLDELVDAQKRFVADASHQLRSPLTALRLRLENLEATTGNGVGESVAAAGREVQRLSRIVDGLLALGRAGQDQPPPEDVDLVEVVTQRCDAWSALASERNVELTVAVAPVPACRLVPGDLDQMLDNLLANALEVSPNGGRITMAANCDSGRTELHVVDQGPGMDAEDRMRAFDRFWQAPGRPSGHSGLGLAIVRQLAARNGMKVELRDGPAGGLDAVLAFSRSLARQS